MKKAISFILALAMLFSLLPTTAFASAGTQQNPWNGKTAVFVGDSITAGVGTEKIYHQYLKETLGFSSVTAMGVAGSCISAASDYGQTNQPLINRYQNIPSADLIVIFMGTNDYGHETPLGSAADTQDGTFYGALNTIVSALTAKHPNSKILFVTPLHRYGFGTSKILGTPFTYDNIPNGVGATLGDYVNALKTVCANNDVPVIDLNTEFTLDPADASIRASYMPDGLHPNAAGHELIAGIMASHIRSISPPEEAAQTELIFGNKFADGFSQQNRASSRVNQYLKAGTVITLKEPAVFQWACTKTSGEHSTDNRGYFPDSAWSDKDTAVVEADGWVGFVFKYRDETRTFDLTKPLSDYITIEEPRDEGFEGKTISILGDSISTFSNHSNGTAAQTTNSTITDGAIYYPRSGFDVTADSTWWYQAAKALGMEVLVNNSWSGSCLLNTRYGTVGAYVDRCVQLHDDTGDNAGQKPDIIAIFLGTNDYYTYPGTLGSYEAIDFGKLITRADGVTTYATPATSMEAYAIILDKISTAYPDAEVYCLTMLPRYNSSSQPTAFNEDIAQLAEKYGAFVVDLSDCGIFSDTTRFNLFMGDNLHPNNAGMDAMTNAFVSAVLKNSALAAGQTTYDVAFDLDNFVAMEGTTRTVISGEAFEAKLTPLVPSLQLNVSVQMGGKDVTADCYSGGVVRIPAVSGNVVISASLVERDPLNFRWDFDDEENTLVSSSSNGNVENALTMTNGSITDGKFSKVKYTMGQAVTLKHDRPWIIEWRSEGSWTDTTDGALLFAGASNSATADTPYLYRRHNSDFIALGVYTGGQYHNYGVALAANGIDGTKDHTYRLVNRIHDDGSNMVYLYVDDVEIGPMNHHWIGGTDKKETVNWLNGQDLTFTHMGTSPHTIGNCYIDYIQVWENGHEHSYENGICIECGSPAPVASEQMTLRYDDHVDMTGKSVQIVSGKSVVSMDNNYLVATGIGTALVRIDGLLYQITVKKAKVNLIMIMGQSNAGNHFPQAISDVTCPIGTAYWWGNNLGTAATAPVPYTQSSMGFHSPLLAELYAQSEAAGDPVKNVLIWHEGITSKNGESIVKWAASSTDTSGTNDAVTMLENCRAYYEQHSDLYEIVRSGIYWLQGESDASMDPTLYTQRFLAMWGRLKEAGM